MKPDISSASIPTMRGVPRGQIVVHSLDASHGSLFALSGHSFSVYVGDMYKAGYFVGRLGTEVKCYHFSRLKGKKD